MGDVDEPLVRRRGVDGAGYEIVLTNDGLERRKVRKEGGGRLKVSSPPEETAPNADSPRAAITVLADPNLPNRDDWRTNARLTGTADGFRDLDGSWLPVRLIRANKP